MNDVCGICCENYNFSTHTRIICEFADCQYNACKMCIRTYLVSTTVDPNCMTCKKLWSDQFVITNLNKSFFKNDYKHHRKELLTERELSKLNDTMLLAEQTKKILSEKKHIAAIDLNIRKLNKEHRLLTEQRKTHLNNIRLINETDNAEHRKFIMNCPYDGCRGFLSSQYKCEICEMHTCPQCLEIIGNSKNIPHTCNPENIASAEFIKKDTKPCPQCGVRIHKTHGCNQMWCTQCHIAFDYYTLKIDTGRVHNPEYYRYLQEHNETIPREPGDIVCGGIIGTPMLIRTISPIITHCQSFSQIPLLAELKQDNLLIHNIHRIISHLQFYDLPRLRLNIATLQDNKYLRVCYIFNEITKKEFSDKIYKNDIKRKRENELLHIFELLNQVGTETFNSIYDDAIKIQSQPKLNKVVDASNFITSLNEKITNLNNLKDYCNNRFIDISSIYNIKIKIITEQWSWP